MKSLIENLSEMKNFIGNAIGMKNVIEHLSGIKCVIENLRGLTQPPLGFLDVDDTGRINMTRTLQLLFKTWNGAEFWYGKSPDQSESDGRR